MTFVQTSGGVKSQKLVGWCIPDRIGIWMCWFLWSEENRRTRLRLVILTRFQYFWFTDSLAVTIIMMSSKTYFVVAVFVRRVSRQFEARWKVAENKYTSSYLPSSELQYSKEQSSNMRKYSQFILFPVYNLAYGSGVFWSIE